MIISHHHASAAAQRKRRGGDAGAVGGVEVLPFSVLIFVVGSLLITNAWGVIDAKLAATSAAREAARAYVEADSAGEGDGAARQAAATVIDSYGRDPSRMGVSYNAGTPFIRCNQFRFEVTYEVPGIALPWVGGLGTITVRGRHAEIVDPLRDALAEENSCGF